MSAAGGVPDHYATLGVASTASAREIRSARKRLLGIHHPDVSRQDAEAARRMTLAILLAGEVLLDARARAAYDLELARAGGGPGPARRDRARQRDGSAALDLRCEGCGRVNVRTRRHYCIFCGAGIGETPRPINLASVRGSRHRHDAPGVHAGCGCLAGAVVGGLLVLQAAWRVEAVVVLIAAPAVIFAFLAHRHGDAFWDRLMGLFR